MAVLNGGNAPHVGLNVRNGSTMVLRPGVYATSLLGPVHQGGGGG